MADLVIVDEDGASVVFDELEAASFLALTDGLDAATTSACPQCRSRVVSVVALGDLLDGAPSHARTTDIVELADDAPTLHLYVVDGGSRCAHRLWRDPGHEEWVDAVTPPGVTRRRP